MAMSSALGGCSSDKADVTPDASADITPDARAYDTRYNEAYSSYNTPPDASADAGDSRPDGPEAGDSRPDGPEASDSRPDGPEASDLHPETATVPRITNPQVPTADATTLAADNAAFASAMYKKLALENENLVFSPVSISLALAMTYAGAAGPTAAEMAQTMHFSLPPARLHPAFNALDLALASRGEGKAGADDGPMVVRIANALWGEKTLPFLPSFLDTLAANYGAGMNLLDFASQPEAARITINEWVAGQTANKIPELLPQDSIDKHVKLVLTNAIYLNAAWAKPFSPNMTRDSTFIRLDDSMVTTKFMEADSVSLPAVQGSNYQAVSLAYSDPNLSLVVVLPDSGQFAEVESVMNANMLSTLVGTMTQKKVSLFLPRFRVATGSVLKPHLQALGMTTAFTSSADFSGMTTASGLSISEVVHKAFIDVAEKGTEAAAATGVVMKDSGIPSVDLSFRAYRPFLFFLRDQPTGAILFMGRVLDPTKN